jgi:hypothetical protein
MQMTLFQIHLVPTQRDQLRDAQAMPERHQDKCPVSVPMSSNATGSGHQCIYFVLGEVLTGTNCFVPLP